MYFHHIFLFVLLSKNKIHPITRDLSRAATTSAAGSEEGLRTSGVGLDGLGARPPAGRAHLSVLISVLEGLHEAENLFGVAADGAVVDHDRAKDTLIVDDEQTAESGASIVAIGDQNTVIGSNLLVKVPGSSG